MRPAKFKRFYETAVAQARTAAEGYRILLDGRPVRTPAKAELSVPTRALATAVAAEWSGQGAEVDLRSMPLTALACTAIDLVRPNRARVVGNVAAYAGHDLVCYRAETPADLAARQHAVWQPLLDWAALAFDAPLTVTAGVVSAPQPPLALAALRRAVERLSDMELAALSCAVTAAGSLVIGLALAEGRIGAEEAFAAAQLDELYQAERWGEDPEAAQRRKAIRSELEAAARVFDLLGR
ncbi:MAG: ATP12 family chaperone protein [Kiloniellaceae bacterium]